MARKITYKKIKTVIPEDIFISHIDNLIGTTSHVTLKVNIKDIKVYELDNTMFVLLDMFDDSGNLKGLMVGYRDDEDFTFLVDDIYTDKVCKVYGKYCLLDNLESDINLPFEIGDNRLFCIQAFQDLSSIQLYGVNIRSLYNYDLNKAYIFVKDNTNYLTDISLDEVKNIQFSAFKDIIILLQSGTVLVNGERILDNVNILSFINGLSIFAITNDKIIVPLTRKDDDINFINDNDYEYKKIIVTPIMLLGLTYDGYVKIFGDLIDVPIDYKKLVNVNDVGYVGENDDVVVIQNGKVFSLFSKCNYLNSKPSVMVDGAKNDILIIE